MTCTTSSQCGTAALGCATKNTAEGGYATTRGFTLIEVLAAIVLVAIVLPVVMRGISLATSAAGISRQRTEAASLGSMKLHELVATGQWQNGSTSGDFAGEYPDYQWSAQIADWTDPDLEQLDVKVMWTARGRQQSITVSTLIYPNTCLLYTSDAADDLTPTGPESTTSTPSTPSNGARGGKNNTLGGLP